MRRIQYPRPQLLAVAAPTPERREDTSRGTTWPDAEVEWLRLHYGRFPMKFIAQQLRRSPLSCRIKMHRIRKGRKERAVDNKMKDGNVSRFTAVAAQ